MCGIGHTRWATHGGVINANAHPHKVSQVALIHNGIIENYHELITKYNLFKDLTSETDTEVVVIFQLVAYFTSTGKGLDPDQPRNLAKSATVE